MNLQTAGWIADQHDPQPHLRLCGGSAAVQILWVMHVVTGEEFSLFSTVDLL